MKTYSTFTEISERFTYWHKSKLLEDQKTGIFRQDIADLEGAIIIAYRIEAREELARIRDEETDYLLAE